MLTSHYILMFLKIYLVLRIIFKITEAKKFGWINILNLIVFVTIDITRYINYGRFVMNSIDSIFGTVMVIFGTHYLVKKIKYLPVLLIIYMATSLISMMVSAIISSIFLTGISTMFINEWYSLLGNFAGLLVLLVLCLIIQRNEISFELKDIGLRGSIFLFIGLFIYGYHLNNFWMLNNMLSESVLRRFVDMLSLIVGYVAVFCIFLLLHKNNRLKVKILNEQYLEKLLLQKRRYEEAEKKRIEAIRKMGHDINEHLISIAMLDNKNKSLSVSSYIKELLGISLETILISEEETGSSIISANLHYLKNKYSCFDINFSWEGKMPNLKISDRDLTDLFVNLLKNAFEASSKDDRKRYIEVSIRIGINDTLHIKVKNNHGGNFRKNGEHFLTTKKDEENHGFGLKIISEIVEKYRGCLKINNDEREFEIGISFRSDIYVN